MKLSLCVDSLYNGIPVENSVSEVLSMGFGTIEFWGWWDKNLEFLHELVETDKLKISALCTDFISLVDESCRQNYIEALKKTVETAKYLRTGVIISQVGNELPIGRDLQKDSLIAGLREAAPIVEAAGLTLTIEPLNTRVDHKGYFLSSSDEALELLQEVDSPNVKMLFDIYHQQISEGDVCRHIEKCMPYIGHFHIAGNPGRGELYNSELNNLRVLETINACGYEEYVALEYFPTDPVPQGLDYARELFAGFRN